MIDEFFGDFDSFQEETKAEVTNLIKEKTTVWIAMCNDYHGNKILPADVDNKEKLEVRGPLICQDHYIKLK